MSKLFIQEIENAINQAATKIFTKLLQERAEREEKAKLALEYPHKFTLEPEEEVAFDAIAFMTPYGKNPSAYTQTLSINDKITALAKDYNLDKIDSYGSEKLAILHKINYKSSYDDSGEVYQFKHIKALQAELETFFSFSSLKEKMNYLLMREHNFQLDPQFQDLDWVYLPEIEAQQIVYNPERLRQLKENNKQSSTGLMHRDTLVVVPTNLGKENENSFYKLRLIDGFHRLITIQERKKGEISAFLGTRSKVKLPPKPYTGVPPDRHEEETEYKLNIKK